MTDLEGLKEQLKELRSAFDELEERFNDSKMGAFSCMECQVMFRDRTHGSKGRTMWCPVCERMVSVE